MKEWVHGRFHLFARKSAMIVGSSAVFTVTCLAFLLWILFDRTQTLTLDTHVFIHTFIAFLTLVLVVLLQNVQNNDTKALHTKLDNLLEIHGAADKRLIDVEDRPLQDLEALREEHEGRYHAHFGRL